MEILVDRNGAWQPVTKEQVFIDAANGLILPETILFIDGKQYPARKIKGITFPSDPVQSVPVPTQVVPVPTQVPVPPVAQQPPQMIISRYCPHCGNGLIATAVVCPKCGSDVSLAPKESSKSLITFQLLAFFFGVFGIHNFYAGRVAFGIAQLILTFVLVAASAQSGGMAVILVWIWAWLDIFVVRADSKGLRMK